MEQNNVTRIAGLGIAIPFQLWHWPRLLGIDSANMDTWRVRNIQAELAANIDMPVFLQNDATAACSSERVFGTADLPGNFLQFYLASFIGGWVVLNGSLFAGPRGNAGAIGSMLVPNSNGRTSQLIDLASLVVLEDMLVKSNHDPSSLWAFPHGWEFPDGIRQKWLLQAGGGIAYATHYAIVVFDFEAICIDGWMPDDLCTDAIAVIEENLDQLDFTELERPRLVAGTTGANTRVGGGQPTAAWSVLDAINRLRLCAANIWDTNEHPRKVPIR